MIIITNELPYIPIRNEPKQLKSKLVIIIGPFLLFSAKWPKIGEGSPAAKYPIVPRDPRPIQISVEGKRSPPTRRSITGNMKKGISTLP
jgi:hypothetical protein